MTFPEDSCKHWTLGCTLRSSWISPGPDHYVAREIAPQRDKKDRACQNQVDLPSSAETRPGPRLPALRLVCVLSTLQWNKKGPSLQEPSRPSLLSREQTSPSLPALCLVCFLNASVEQERTEPARTKLIHKDSSLPASSPSCTYTVPRKPTPLRLWLQLELELGMKKCCPGENGIFLHCWRETTS
ncbi:uncharacterized protein LOC129634548 isoform X5 [Bubalus kerabau]|uniref:uncharacterized protein LOC129634548 isoform X5 n=1 Tax=Bubalus carabanensis TaxID=3119969 RepID=UPI00244E998A|nr:uncharacterized protein LOC129634548 isoform X5 [Bubalus carabanensis]